MNKNSESRGIDQSQTAGMRLQALRRLQRKISMRSMLSEIMFHCGALRLLEWWRRGFQSGPRLLILMYHRVSPTGYGYTPAPVSPEQFARQLKYLRRHFEIISLDVLCSCLSNRTRLARDCVAVTFDDGYQDNYRYAFPLLRQYRIPATIFLPTGFIGERRFFWWDRVSRLALAVAGRRLVWTLSDTLYPSEIQEILEQLLQCHPDRATLWVQCLECLLKELPGNHVEQLLTDLERQAAPWLESVSAPPLPLRWEEVRKMHQAGIDFGSHTIRHAILTNISKAEAQHEINGSKTDLKRELGKPPRHFAYPNGKETDYDSEIQEMLKTAGFVSASTTTSGVNDGSTGLFALHRIGVDHGGLAKFAVRLAGCNEFWSSSALGMAVPVRSGKQAPSLPSVRKTVIPVSAENPDDFRKVH